MHPHTGTVGLLYRFIAGPTALVMACEIIHDDPDHPKLRGGIGLPEGLVVTQQQMHVLLKWINEQLKRSDLSDKTRKYLSRSKARFEDVARKLGSAFISQAVLDAVAQRGLELMMDSDILSQQ